MSFLHPVIHVDDEAQARTQAEVARECGADGIWLIGHSMPAKDLWAIWEKVKRDDRDFWVGINFLDLTALQAMERVGKYSRWVRQTGLAPDVDGLWTDNAGADDLGVSEMAQGTWNMKKGLHPGADWHWPGLYFGGVAFKYQRPVRDWALAAKNAASVMDVVTTSGPGTGRAASIDKIRWMSTEAPTLAIASGITPENAQEYLGWATYFLVATGISKSFTELDPERTKRLADILHASRI